MRMSLASRAFGCVLVLVACLLSAGDALAAGDINQAACPNESSPGFRAYLPDCRAYELVTPPDKEGVLVRLSAQPTSAHVAADGSRLVGSSSGAFAGLACDELGTVGEADYRFTRTGSGWATTPLNPCQEVPHIPMQSQSLGVGDSVWAPTLTRNGVDHLTLVQEDGAVSDIGPVWPPAVGAFGGYHPYRVLGAASEASHGVVFAIENSTVFWPFDTTVSGNSLYEYKGTGNTMPSLVGVSGGAGSTTLISECGVALGGYVHNPHGAPFPEGYNAVSADGETVFFTAEAGGCSGENRNHESVIGSGPPISELYARLTGPETRTVAISEPTTGPEGDCEECDTSAAAMNATTEPAAFQGASEDGSKVFFTTNQELLPGQKGTNLYEYDFDAPAHHKIVLVSTGSPEPQVQGVSRVSLDGSHVYFVAAGVLSSDPNNEGQSAQASANNLYVYERDGQYPTGHVAFVAQLCSEAGTSGTVSDPQCPSSVSPGVEHSDETLVDGLGGEGDQSRPVQATPDGRFLVFLSYGDLTAGDTSSTRQVFQYDAQTGDLVRVSIRQDGYNNNGNTTAAVNNNEGERDATIVAQDYFLSRGGAIARTMSDDGSYVFFQSPVGLTPQALNLVQVTRRNGAPVYAQNVYEYHDGHVSLISDGRDTSSVIATSGEDLIGTTASGADVFFRSEDQLVPQDTDTQMDFYDARIDGGFPAPAAPASCEGEGCQAPSSATPVFGAPVSANFAGSGNLTPPAITPVAKPNPLTRAQELTKALKACKKKPKKKRASCKAQARKKYGNKSKASKGKRGNK